MPIAFGPEICGDPAAAGEREWLVTDGLGGYACGTVSGCLTRSYHGLLITARHPPVDRRLLVSRLEEAVAYADQTFALSTIRWADGRMEPRGHRWIESFALEGTVPRWRYRLADALLEKRIWMEPGAPTTYISYRLLEATAPLRLTLAAWVHPRSHQEASRQRPWSRIRWPAESG
jgi:predicted glycogen debranching enzyme